MTSQAADRPEPAGSLAPLQDQRPSVSRVFDAVLEQSPTCGYDAAHHGFRYRRQHSVQQVHALPAVEDQAPVRGRRTALQPPGALHRHRHRVARRGPSPGGDGPRARGAGRDYRTAPGARPRGHGGPEPRARCARRSSSRRSPRSGTSSRAASHGVRSPAGHPALEYVPTLFGMLRMRPVVEGEQADADTSSGSWRPSCCRRSAP